MISATLHRTRRLVVSGLERAVYPPKKPKGFDPLEFLTFYFNLIEINSTFYRMPAPATVRAGPDASPHAGFPFTVKIHREFTHESPRVDARNVDVFKRSVAPLYDAGVCSSCLLQFPWSSGTRNPTATCWHASSRPWRLTRTAVELRHGGWAHGDAIDEIAGHGAAVCAVDQPAIGDSSASTPAPPARRALTSACTARTNRSGSAPAPTATCATTTSIHAVSSRGMAYPSGPRPKPPARSSSSSTTTFAARRSRTHSN